MRCSSCNSTLKVIEYQSRSADEAQRSILRCPNCPLNADEFLKGRINVHVHLARRQRIIHSTPVIDSSASRSIKFICGRSKLSNINLDFSNRYPVFATNYVDNKGRMFRHHHNGSLFKTAIYVMSRIQIAPNIRVIEAMAMNSKEISDNQYMIHECSNIDGQEYIINQDSVSVWLPIDNDNEIPMKVEQLYVTGFAPLKLSEFISQATLSSMSNLSARAYDKYQVADYDHRFTHKPDGERYWVTRAGMVSLFSKRHLDHSIGSWQIDSKVDISKKYTIGPVIDTEFIFGFKLELIDILMDGNGSIMTQQRTLDTINPMFKELQNENPALSMIQVRPFFDTYKDAASHRDSVLYPTDGIVAISRHGTDMFKIKDERSMELELMDDGRLCTSEGISLMTSNYHEVYQSGTIIEIRFSINDGNIDVKDVFHRSDKRKANDMNAVRGIIESSTRPSDNTADALRTEIRRWCDNLRSTMYSHIYRDIKERGIILDIGTGDGQAVDAFLSMDNVSFIFIEPNEMKCRRLIRRLQIKSYHKEPRSVVNMSVVSGLKKGTVKYHVLNCTALQVLSDDATMNTLKGIVSRVTACFSAQFMMNELSSMVTQGMKVTGCCYLYDNIPPGSSIINDFNLKMQRVNQFTADVKWGTDDTYSEPALESTDIIESFVKIPAINFIGTPSDTYNGLLRRVCSHIWILRSI